MYLTAARPSACFQSHLEIGSLTDRETFEVENCHKMGTQSFKEETIFAFTVLGDYSSLIEQTDSI